VPPSVPAVLRRTPGGTFGGCRRTPVLPAHVTLPFMPVGLRAFGSGRLRGGDGSPAEVPAVRQVRCHGHSAIGTPWRESFPNRFDTTDPLTLHYRHYGQARECDFRSRHQERPVNTRWMTNETAPTGHLRRREAITVARQAGRLPTPRRSCSPRSSSPGPRAPIRHSRLARVQSSSAQRRPYCLPSALVSRTALMPRPARNAPSSAARAAQHGRGQGLSSSVSLLKASIYRGEGKAARWVSP
jgi:hypothetical protein